MFFPCLPTVRFLNPFFCRLIHRALRKEKPAPHKYPFLSSIIPLSLACRPTAKLFSNNGNHSGAALSNTASLLPLQAAIFSFVAKRSATFCTHQDSTQLSSSIKETI